jgi:hypothetical protein
MPDTSPALPEPRPPWSARRPELLVALLVGVVLRLVRLADNPSLWGDEAALSLNILDRSPGALLGPLDYHQSAPPLFLLSLKLAATLLGEGEVALRLLPFLFSLASLGAVGVVARRHACRPTGLVLLLLTALADPLVFYAAQVKQYSLEVLIASLFLLFVQGLTRGEGAAKHPGPWVALCALAPLASHTAVFLLAAAGLALLAESLLRRDARLRKAALLGTGTGSAVFGLYYLLHVRHVRGDEYILDYWSIDFLPFPPRTAEEWLWLPRRLLGFLNDPLGIPHPHLAALVALLGLWWLLRTPSGRATGLLALGAMTLLLGASAQHLYPFTASMEYSVLDGVYPYLGRLVLFMAPLGHLVLAEGLGRLVAHPRRWIPPLGCILAAAVLFWPGRIALRQALDPPPIQELRPVMRAMATSVSDRQAFFVHLQGWVVFEYYRRQLGWRLPFVYTVHEQTDADREAFRRSVAALHSGAEAWLVFLFHPQWETGKAYPFYESVLAEQADRVAVVREVNALAVLFRMR